MANTAIVTYRGRLDYELNELAEQYSAGEFDSDEAYADAIAAKSEQLAEDITASFLYPAPRGFRCA